MALSNMMNVNAIVKGGSSYGCIKVVNADGSDVTGESVVQLPIISTSNVKFEQAIDEIEGEGAETYYLEGKENGEIEIEFLQQDKVTKELSWTLKGKYIHLFKEQSNKAIGGKYQYLDIPIIKVMTVVEENQPGGKVKIKGKIMKVSGALTTTISAYAHPNFQVDLSASTDTLTYGTGSTDYQYYQFYETA